MNLPNKLTIFRILLIPVIILVYSVKQLRESFILFPNLSQAKPYSPRSDCCSRNAKRIKIKLLSFFFA